MISSALSAIPVLLLWHRQKSYGRNVEMLLIVTFLFFAQAAAAVFSLVTAEMFREFMLDADEFVIKTPSDEFVIDVAWSFGYSWALMICCGIVELFMIFMTMYLYYEKAQVQNELDSQFFV